jgi:glycosyltransferase involved in cell wall biosynthesis
VTARRPVVWAVVRGLGRTGVPIALTRLATWPATRQEVDLHVVARDDGPLRHELERAGTSVVVLEPSPRSLPATLAAGAAHLGRPGPGRTLLGAAWRRRASALPRPDVVLLQGAGAWPIAEALHLTDGPRLVLHLHELALGLRRSMGEAEQQAAARRADRVLVVSEPVADLARRIGVPADRTTIVPGTVALADRAPTGRSDLLTVGEAGWRKGTDRAIAAAHEVRRLDPRLRWHWIGRGPEPGWTFAHGSALPLTFHQEAEDPWSVVDAPAALVVTSREDPLPLVALEAGARGIPVVACAGSGGLDQLLADGRGTLVDPTDPRDLARAAQQATTASAEALAAYVSRHHTLDVVGPTWLAALTGTDREPSGQR